MLRWASLPLLLSAFVGVRAQDGAGALPHPDTDERLAAFVARVVPAVEAACGRRFITSPRAVLADTVDFEQVMLREAAAEVEAFYAGMPQRRIERALRMRAQVGAASLMGKYAYEDGAVMVRPGSVPLQLFAVGARDADEVAVLQLVVVHELVHALQDQQLGMRARVAEIADAQALDRLSALLEGHAVLCSERAADALGIDAAIGPLRGVFTGVVPGKQRKLSGLETRRIRGRGQLLYADAAAWLGEVEREHGVEHLWQMLATTPPPEPPPARERELQDLSPLLDGLPAQLGPSTWVAGKGPLDVTGLLSETLAEVLDSRAQLAAACVGGAMMQAMGPTPVLWRNVQVLRFVDGAAASEFARMAERCAERDVGVPAQDGPALVGGGVSRRLEQSKPYGGVSGAISWFRRGVHLVQVTCIGAPFAAGEEAAFAEAALQRLEQADRDAAGK